MRFWKRDLNLAGTVGSGRKLFKADSGLTKSEYIVSAGKGWAVYRVCTIYRYFYKRIQYEAIPLISSLIRAHPKKISIGRTQTELLKCYFCRAFDNTYNFKVAIQKMCV